MSKFGPKNKLKKFGKSKYGVIDGLLFTGHVTQPNSGPKSSYKRP